MPVNITVDNVKVGRPGGCKLMSLHLRHVGNDIKETVHVLYVTIIFLR